MHPELTETSMCAKTKQISYQSLLVHYIHVKHLWYSFLLFTNKEVRCPSFYGTLLLSSSVQHTHSASNNTLKRNETQIKKLKYTRVNKAKIMNEDSYFTQNTHRSTCT